MALMPKRVKYRKAQNGKCRGVATSGDRLAFGEYGLKVLENGRIRSNHIEACRVAINRHMKRKGKLWLRVFPDKPVTKKPIETRMGKGKGNTEYWVAVIRPGKILFEVGGVHEQIAREAIRLAATKLGFKTRLVTRQSK